MAKIISFVPKVISKKHSTHPAQVINIEEGGHINCLKRAVLAINSGDMLYACEQYNKAIDIFLNGVFYPNDSIWQDILERIYGFTGNYELLFNSMARYLRFDKDMLYLFNMWGILKVSRQEKKARLFQEYLINNNLVDAFLFDDKNIILKDFDTTNNLNVIINKVTNDINNKRFDRAFKYLHFAYELDRTNPFVSYLYFNADEAFDGKLTKTLPEMYIMQRIKEIEDAVDDEKAYEGLWEKEDSESLIRFLTNYGSIGLNEKFYVQMLSKLTKKAIYYCETALISEGKGLLKKQLLLYLLASGLSNKLCIIHNDLPRVVVLHSLARARRIHPNLELSIIEALNVLLDITNCYSLDLTYEINTLLKGCNKSNIITFDNIDLTRDVLVYFYLLRNNKKLLKKLFVNDEIFKIIFEKFNINTSFDFVDNKHILLFKPKETL